MKRPRPPSLLARGAAAIPVTGSAPLQARPHAKSARAHLASRWQSARARARWWHFLAVAVLLYITAPSVHAEWNPGWSRRCPADAIPSATRCFSNFQRAEVPTLPLDSSEGHLSIVRPHIHAALALNTPHVRLFSVDFGRGEYLGFGTCDVTGRPYAPCGYGGPDGPVAGPSAPGAAPVTGPSRSWRTVPSTMRR